jgi:drug/metabolite transporter (DMT)-like permease
MIISILLYDIDILFMYNLRDIYPFIISGTMSTGIGRFLNYKSIDLVGAGINSSFIASNTVFGIVLSYIFLNETLTKVRVFGFLRNQRQYLHLF